MGEQAEAMRQLDAGERLITEGEPGGTLYQLRSGALDIVRDGVAIAQVSEPGAFLGEMSLLLGRPATASVVAHNAAVDAELPDAIERFRTDPELLLAIARLLAHRVDTMNDYLA